MISDYRDHPLPGAVHTAIIGGGIAGLYAAYRLRTGDNAERSPTDDSVAVFEATPRVGGRLCTARLDTDDFVADLGAMRYLPSQKLLSNLVQNVLSSDPRARPVAAESGPTVFHLRAQTFSLEDMRDTAKSPQLAAYGLVERWRGMAPGDIVETVVEEVLRADGFSSQALNDDERGARRVWDRVKRTARYRFDGPFRDRLLCEMSVYNVVMDRAGLAAFQFVRDGLGHDSDIAWGAAEAFEEYSCELAPGESYLTPAGGMDVIATGLHMQAVEAGAGVHTRARLLSFEHADTDEFRYKLHVADDIRGTVDTVLANNVVLALPRLALEPLQSSMAAIGGQAAGYQFGAAVRSVGLIPAVKVVMWFETAWWAEQYGLNANLVTDLPLRQSVMYGSAEAGARSVVIATYADMEGTLFWKAAQAGGGHKADGSPQIASDAVVQEVMRQLGTVFGDAVSGAVPVKSVCKVWDGERDGDGTAYHFWQAGSRMRDVAQWMRMPVEGERVFVCGEAYSDRHGWVEGSLCTTEHVMRDSFGLKQPDWMLCNTKDEDAEGAYYLGW